MEDFQKQLEAIKKGYQLQLEATKEDAQADLSAEQQRLEQQMETLQVMRMHVVECNTWVMAFAKRDVLLLIRIVHCPS